MPRLCFSISESFEAGDTGERPDRYGRSVRHVSGVHYVGEENFQRPLLGPLFFKVSFVLSIIAMLAMSLAMWRLFQFPH